MILASARTLLPGGLAPGWVRVDGERIGAVGLGDPPAGPVVDLGEAVISPGLVDMHCHGGGGGSFPSGEPDQARAAVAAHRRAGTTSLMASLVADSPDRLREQVRGLAPLVAAGELVGVHLEGPCLSPAHHGAHDPALLRSPADVDLVGLVDDLTDEFGPVVRMVTLAPELDGGPEAVRGLAARGVIAAVGHTDATYEQTRAALAAGAPVATHLCNAMRGLHHREPGPILACLQDEHVAIEVIADGVHLAAPVVAGLFAAAGERVVLITDALSAAGLGDGPIRLGPLDVVVRDGVARVVATGAIAGSTLTLSRALDFCVRRAGVDLAAALAAATAHPARALRRDDLGVLAAGARADLVVFDTPAEPADPAVSADPVVAAEPNAPTGPDGGPGRAPAGVNVARVMRAGRWLDDAEPA